MMTVKGSIRKYLGSIETQELAARFYDKYSIIMWGLEAKTNFSYDKPQAIQLINQSDLNKDEFLFQHP